MIWPKAPLSKIFYNEQFQTTEAASQNVSYSSSSEENETNNKSPENFDSIPSFIKNNSRKVIVRWIETDDLSPNRWLRPYRFIKTPAVLLVTSEYYPTLFDLQRARAVTF